MYEPRYQRSPPKGRTNFASCIVATVFLLLLVAAGVTVFFLLFNPKNPRVAVNGIQFPTFSLTNGTLDFTLFQYVTVTNPNRDAFTHYDSSMELVYSGSQVGVVFIPAGQIGGGRTQHMSAKFDVQKYPMPARPGGVSTVSDSGGGNGIAGGAGSGPPPTMEIETRMKLVGRVRVLQVFSHRVESKVRCSVAIEVSRGTVLGLHC